MKTKKITQTGLLLASLVLASLVPVTAFAAEGEVADQPITVAPGVKDANTTTEASVTVKAGDLSASGFQDVSFPEIAVGEVWKKGYDEGQNSAGIKLHVEDFTGVPDSTWKVSVKAGEWAFKADSGSEKGAEVLNANAELSVMGTTLNGGTAADVFSGHSGTYDTPEKDALVFNLKMKQGTDVKAGSYTNTLTWSISNTTGENVE